MLLIGEHQIQLKNLCSRQGELVGMEVILMQYFTLEKWVDSHQSASMNMAKMKQGVAGHFYYQTSCFVKKRIQ